MEPPPRRLIALDTNILVFAARDGGPAGDAVRESLRQESAAFVVPVFCVGEFWRVVTDRRAMQGLTPERALTFIREVVPSERALLRPGRRYWPILRRLLAERRPLGLGVFDLQIAAVCLERGCGDIWTFDEAFPQAGGLVASNPLG
jgi:predicted nucleic acid-binding protein